MMKLKLSTPCTYFADHSMNNMKVGEFVSLKVSGSSEFGSLFLLNHVISTDPIWL